MTKSILSFLAVLVIGGMVSAMAASPVIGPEHSRNLKLLESSPLLFEMHRQTTGNHLQYFAYPRRDTNFIKHFQETEGTALLYIDSESKNAPRAGRASYGIAASIVGGVDYRGADSLVDTAVVGGASYRNGATFGDTIWPSVDGGLYLRGYIDSVDFVLDARIYDEGHSSNIPKSYDREFLEVQDAEDNSGVEYVSYARYRAHFAFNYDWLRIDLARDVMHWGPGYYNNLTLNQFALPYNMLSMDMFIGPLHVLTFYGDLRIYNNSMSKKNKDELRNLFGHRYELAVGNATVGISEIQVLYDNMKPWLFVPCVPLFMEKGNYSERSNNGALAMDFNYRLFHWMRLYTEFFMDDMESPVSLVKNDNIEAKWAWMAGMQAAHDFKVKGKLLEAGTIAEYARIEPYVYSHFIKNTAQLAHLGYPLGNQNGPNSMVVDWTVYGRYDGKFFASVRNSWFWKGTDYGSAVNDTTPSTNHMKISKKFLDGAKMRYSITPSLGYEGNYVSFMGELTLFNDEKVYLRAGFKF